MKPSAALVLVLVLASSVTGAGCKRDKKKQPDAERPVTATATATGIDDGVDPVYPASIAPNPVAARLCTALHALPAKRTAECCGKTPGLLLTGECTRMLSGALSFEAVTLAPDAVDRCVAELEKAHEGCGWVGGAPQIPAGCRGLVTGTLAKGTSCRSTLECTAGLRCQGVGPTDPGVCFPPLPAGAPCETSVDSLVSFTKQSSVFRLVPECEGACEQHRCQPAVALGAACTRAEQCGLGNRCVKSHCVAGALAGDGDGCLASTDCRAGLHCIAAVCAVPKPAGAACTADDDCLGVCARKEPASSRKEKAGTGICANRC